MIQGTIGYQLFFYFLFNFQKFLLAPFIICFEFLLELPYFWASLKLSTQKIMGLQFYLDLNYCLRLYLFGIWINSEKGWWSLHLHHFHTVYIGFWYPIIILAFYRLLWYFILAFQLIKPGMVCFCWTCFLTFFFHFFWATIFLKRGLL